MIANPSGRVPGAGRRGGRRRARSSNSSRAASSGTWRVDFVTPLGQNWIIMTINQSGTKLTGHATDEFGEYEINGRVVDDQVTVVWSVRRRRQDARDHDEGQARERDADHRDRQAR